MDLSIWVTLDMVVWLLTYLAVVTIGVGVITIVFDYIAYIIDSTKEREDMGNNYSSLLRMGLIPILSGIVLIFGLIETNLI